MRVLVTGHLGYIGSHLVGLLKDAGHHVTGVDLGLFEDCAWASFTRPDVELRKDVRLITPEDVEGHDCVMHLAAISNDPMGDLDPSLTLSVNRDASVTLAKIAKSVGVPRFLFAGSCSVYGAGEKLDLEEGDPLNPLTAYAQSKIETEQLVSEIVDDTFTAVFLRNATAYGTSPVLRIDIVANNLLASARSYGAIRIMSDGSPWRPLVHCKDIARAFVAFADADLGSHRALAVNVGGNTENYQVRDVATAVGRLLPEARVEYTGEVGEDPRNYRVKFDLLGKVLPDFRLEYDLDRGLVELNDDMKSHDFGRADFEGARFVRLRTLKSRLSWMASA